MSDEMTPELEAYYAKFYGQEVDEQTGNVRSWTPHGEFHRDKNGRLLMHVSYNTQWCKEDGKFKEGKEHDFSGPVEDDGYGGCPTCTVCGVSETHWALRGGYE